MEENTQSRNRYVVFLDIMGFKERVARNTHAKLCKELSEFNRQITDIVNAKPKKLKNILSGQEANSEEVTKESSEEANGIILAQFSDSIVLFTQNDSSESLETIAKAAGDIVRKALTREEPIPIKGALAQGEITCDVPKQLFFGQALIDAYLLEEDVQYYGIVVHHTAEKSVIALKSPLFEDKPVPLKSGNIAHYELAWYNGHSQEVEEGLNRVRLSVSDAPRKYVDNTRKMLRGAKN